MYNITIYKEDRSNWVDFVGEDFWFKGVYLLVIIISKNLYFIFIQLMMYMVFIIDHIHHLINESKILIFAYNSVRRVYIPNISFQHLEKATVARIS